MKQVGICYIHSCVYLFIYFLQVYYGPQARYLYFEVLQLILRMQISFLTKEWNLPAEFEVSRGRIVSLGYLSSSP